jgi:outer membrane receptor for ferrienterochelin and colicins
VFASARTVVITPTNSFGYGLNQEIAWNYGFNLTHYFTYNYKEATLMLDVYRTDFENVVLADVDADPRQVQFYSVVNGAYSNSVQLELNMQIMDGLDIRAAYRYLDVKQELGGVWRQRPLTAQHRALLTLSYATEPDQPSDPKTSVDATLQWYGQKRIPDTILNPDSLRLSDSSPDFLLLNLQATRTLIMGVDLYVGIENVFDYMQPHPIIDSGNPAGQYFDASLIWGPLSGRMIYAGLRLRM